MHEGAGEYIDVNTSIILKICIMCAHLCIDVDIGACASQPNPSTSVCACAGESRMASDVGGFRGLLLTRTSARDVDVERS